MIRSLAHLMLAFVLVVTTSAAVPCACDETDHGGEEPSHATDRREAEATTAAHDCCPSQSEREESPEEEACPHCEMGTCDTMAVDDGQTTLALEWGGFELPTSPLVPVFAVSRPALAEPTTPEPSALALVAPDGDSGRDICVRNQVFRI